MAWPHERSRDGGVDEIPLPGGGGRLWLCGKHVVGPDPDAALLRVGATTVVCLNEADELRRLYPGYLEWLASAPPARSVWRPIPDMHVPTVEGADALVAELTRRLDDGGGLLVHCGAGMGRAGTVAAAVLVSMGLTPDAATAVVAESRPMAGPQTDTQERLLVDLAARWR